MNVNSLLSMALISTAQLFSMIQSILKLQFSHGLVLLEQVSLQAFHLGTQKTSTVKAADNLFIVDSDFSHILSMLPSFAMSYWWYL